VILQLYLYPIALAVISVVVAFLEWLFPWRKDQKQLRKGLFSDFLHLIFNGHFLGLIFFGLATRYLLPPFDHLIAQLGWTGLIYRNAAAAWPLWVQIVVALLVIDFVQWCVHNLLHRVPFFWDFHKCHHSVVDGEMDWIVSFRFQWTEVVVYRVVQYLPLAFFGFSPDAVMFHAIFGTLIGHLNHANLNWDYGWGRYILNSPRMHLWHHNYDGDAKTTVNFGIIFSMWDWIFGTAKMPAEPPPKLGFHGVEEFPKDFLGHEAWPLQQLIKTDTMGAKVAGSFFGLVILIVGYTLGVAPRPVPMLTPMLGERAASSQPSAALRAPASAYSATPEEATKALAAFGQDAKKQGFLRPEWLVSVPELAKALGSPRLVLLDIRPKERYLQGRIPSAQQLDRKDYLKTKPFGGLSQDAPTLQALLQARGVRRDSLVVLYSDGGSDAFRLWWTLKEKADYTTRILDGGLNEWKAQGHGLAEGMPRSLPKGDILLQPSTKKQHIFWEDLAALRQQPHLLFLDARDPDEFLGTRQSKKAARKGRIPNAKNLPWHHLIQSKERRLLKSPQELKKQLATLGIQPHQPIVTYCDSASRSAVLYFVLHQIGHPSEKIINYDGSWIEYSRRKELPTEIGSPKP
jgi:3-mercaptopyruvate sulfurtransferase SseA/sterol desaturase/sphingolipid hydroxylase (fatty acid hydroxylase superfamily)